MRTKTLLLAAALGAAGIASTFAQGVYSVNAVGYVNKTLVASSWYLLNNPLNAATNNIATVIPAPPESTQVFKWDAATQQFVGTATYSFGAWDSPDLMVPPGEAFFLFAGDAGTVTFVGEVWQGKLTNSLPAGWAMAGSQVPQAGLVQTDLNYQPEESDQLFKWNGAGYTTYTFSFGAWDPSEPTMDVAEGMWFSKQTASKWTRDFTIQ